MVLNWSVWLMPNENDSKILQTCINDCCKKFESYAFKPHITLFGRLNINPGPFISILRMICNNHSSITVDVRKVKTGEPPWKALYLQIEKDESLSQLQSEISSYLDQYRPYDFDPHLSLSYGELDNENFNLKSIKFPKQFGFLL